jgi:hypothetical protein
MNRFFQKSQVVPVAWLETDQPIIAQIQHLKRTLSETHRPRRGGPSRLLRLALNEAEALAWQTDYPHLLFPMLAEEKIAQIQLWESRQQRVWSDSYELAFAA